MEANLLVDQSTNKLVTNQVFFIKIKNNQKINKLLFSIGHTISDIIRIRHINRFLRKSKNENLRKF